MSFPVRLRLARLRLGLTQEQLAFELNVTKSTISAWENGRDTPGFRLLPALRAVLGVSLDHLVVGEVAEAPDSAAGTSESAPRNPSEVQLLKLFRRLSARRRDGLLALLE